MAAVFRSRSFDFLPKFCAFVYIFVLVAITIFGTDAQSDVEATARSVRFAPLDTQKTERLKLAEDPHCEDDIKKYCRNQNGKNMNDLAVLDCLQNNVPDEEEVKDACQNSLWAAKKRLSNDEKITTAAGAICYADLKKIDECNNLDRSKAFIIPCLIDHLDNITNAPCKEFLRKMEAIVFSDYRLVYKFVESCGNDIISVGCGRIDDEAKKSIHNQGDTISCLADKLSTLQQECQHQILRVAELQGQDYHMDRQLFFACRDDRESFCAQVRSGNGNIYRCLTAHKFDARMSEKCRKQLTIRQQLQRADYKVNRGLTVACRVHIMNEKCVEHLHRTPTSGLQEARLSVILLCLENATRLGHQLDPECMTELIAVRKSLMEDYKISPEIVSSCSAEIRDHCNNGLEREGKTIHCLMNIARNQRQAKLQKMPTIEKECAKSLGILMKEVDIRENFEIDPFLQDACGSIVRSKCSNLKAGQGKIMDCLMDLVDEPNIMTDQCKAHLMETQYFVSRDFELSPGFYKSCRPLIGPLCRVSIEDLKSEDERSDVLLCLYRNRHAKNVAGECAEAVKQIMMDRAKSVDLEPAVEESCMSELSQYCSDKTGKNEEMDCLEEHLDDLESKCKHVVTKYIEEEEEMPELHEIFMKACEPVLKDHCKEAVGTGKDSDGDSLMNCLIKHKNDEDVPKKCRAGIEHHQLIMLKDFDLSRDFREACKQEVKDHCSQVRTKFEVVSCLSETVLNDTLRESSSRVSADCKKQLKFELIQRGENIQFDPELKRSCRSDLERHCQNITPGKSAQLNCLRNKANELEPECHKFIFKRERQEALDPTTDFVLMTKCKTMIKRYCENELTKPVALFNCLKTNKNEEGFDRQCFRIITQRQRVRAQDIRLNPDLMKDCKQDIMAFCHKEFAKANNSPTEVEGVVIGCLRVQFTRQKKAKETGAKALLSESCAEHLQDLIKESALDYVQDVALAKACREEIKANCIDAVSLDRRDPDGGYVEDCLRKVMMASWVKSKSLTPCGKEVIRTMTEDQTDIQIDPILFKACAIDALHVCKDIQRGEGRKMSCLVSALDDKSVRLRDECRKALENRVKLWEKAMQVAPAENLGEVWQSVQSSPARNYLLAVLFAFIGVIFIGGLFCGRVTKRVAKMAKDR